MSGHQKLLAQALIHRHSSRELVEILKQLREDGEHVLARGVMQAAHQKNKA